MPNMWMVRAGENAYLIDVFKDSNVVAISGEMNFERAVRIVEEFINTNFSGLERHIKRIKQINEYEKKNK